MRIWHWESLTTTRVWIYIDPSRSLIRRSHFGEVTSGLASQPSGRGMKYGWAKWRPLDWLWWKRKHFNYLLINCRLIEDVNRIRMAVGLGMAAEEWQQLRSQVNDSFWVMRVIGNVTICRYLKIHLTPLEDIPHFRMTIMEFHVGHTSKLIIRCKYCLVVSWLWQGLWLLDVRGPSTPSV